MKCTPLIALLFSVPLALASCGGGDESTTDTGTTDGALTLATCAQSIDGAAAFFSTYYACVDISAGDGGTTISTDGLPPHPSPYYSADDPNHVAWDSRGGTHTQNPNEIGAISYEMTVPDDPVAKGLTIDASMVDNSMDTNEHEYSGGPVGIALNGVAIFAAMAAPGDELANEAFTFDLYEGHPAGTTYHYHFETPGPLEVLVDRGISDSSDPGAGTVELYGMMCDGTVVLGCSELDGSAPDTSGFDAQNGHVHDISDGTTTHFANRYHTHVCPGLWPDYPFFPEIAYYDTASCPQTQPPGGGGPPN